MWEEEEDEEEAEKEEVGVAEVVAEVGVLSTRGNTVCAAALPPLAKLALVLIAAA